MARLDWYRAITCSPADLPANPLLFSSLWPEMQSTKALVWSLGSVGSFFLGAFYNSRPLSAGDIQGAILEGCLGDGELVMVVGGFDDLEMMNEVFG